MPEPGPPYVEANLNHLADAGARPGFQATRHGAEDAAPREPARHRVRFHDARCLREPLTLDSAGVALARLESRVDDFTDPGQVPRVYYAEVEALVARVTGARDVRAFDHNLRSDPRARAGEAGVQRPVKFAHNDYTEASGPRRVRELWPEEADALTRGRFAVINVWKPIGAPVEDVPLGVCDARSIDPDDFIASDLRYESRTGEVYSLAYRPKHRWYYYPRMQPDEVMLLKCFDSARDGRARFTAHAAFRDPTAPADAPPRESIEVRTYAFFGSP